MIYFDNNSTTPLDPRVYRAMQPYLAEHHGNPSSAHAAGRLAKEALEHARDQVTGLIGARPREVVFTSSGTEANNAVVLGLARQAGFRGHLVTTLLEHPSIAAAANLARELGMEVTEVPPGPDGVVPAQALISALRPDTRLLCLMLANNEIGTLQPVREVAQHCRDAGVPVLSDAVQAAGKVEIDVSQLGVDYLSLGGHKVHGPLGAAALWLREGSILPPLLVGAPQEDGRRASTENLPALVGLGHAAELARKELASRQQNLRALQDCLEQGLGQLPQTRIHGSSASRLPHTTNVAFLGVSGHRLMLELDAAGFAVSTGAACHAGQPSPSRALLAMGLDRAEALATLRISFGILNRQEEVERLLDTLPPLLERLRQAA